VAWQSQLTDKQAATTVQLHEPLWHEPTLEAERILMVVDISYAASQAHGIVNVALHRKYSPGIVFIFSQGRKDLYHV
jgi:hypothetical protein